MKKSAIIMTVLFVLVAGLKLSCSSYVGEQFNEEKPRAVKNK
jgi:hypothetical protein